jgi:hypothetical protein
MIFPWFSDLSSCCSTSALRVMGQAPRVFQGPWQRRSETCGLNYQTLGFKHEQWGLSMI